MDICSGHRTANFIPCGDIAAGELQCALGTGERRACGFVGPRKGLRDGGKPIGIADSTCTSINQTLLLLETVSQTHR